MSDSYAVIGNPIGHSKSPAIHAAFARQTGEDIGYDRIETAAGRFRDDAEAFRLAGGYGLNITAPFKQDAFAYATDLSESARLSGAVNTLKFSDGRVFGENFDGVALVRDIELNLGFALRGSRVVLLGAGGAARGALLAILSRRPAQVVLVNRTMAKARALLEQFGLRAKDEITCRSYAELNDAGKEADLVINATSASLTGEQLPLNSSAFTHARMAYELAYGKGLTPFLGQARAAGVHHLADGVGMLVEQAADAFEWWRGVRPATAPLIADLTVPLR